jgi:hypothetical protein
MLGDQVFTDGSFRIAVFIQSKRRATRRAKLFTGGIVGADTTGLATTAGEELTLVERDDPSGWAWVCWSPPGFQSSD